MHTGSIALARALYIAGTAIGFIAIAPSTASATDQLVYSFTGSPSATAPEHGLILIGDGNYYGVTQQGGANNKGTIYRIKPKPGNQPAVLQLLYSFVGGRAGERPNVPLVADA